MFNLNFLQWWGMERGKVEGVLPEGVVSGICRIEELWLVSVFEPLQTFSRLPLPPRS